MTSEPARELPHLRRRDEPREHEVRDHRQELGEEVAGAREPDSPHHDPRQSLRRFPSGVPAGRVRLRHAATGRPA